MHGRRRLPPGAEKHMDEENKKAEKAFAIVKAALSARSQGPCPAPILAAASAVLTRNPEVYSLWNMRRESVAEALQGEYGRSTAQEELKLVDKCLEKNHKSYSAWHHRQWVINHNHINLDTELESVEKHLNIVTGDTKNFHAWKYRSWVVEKAGKSPESEEEFTRILLESEPDNFSALHHRIVALAAAHQPASSLKPQAAADQETVGQSEPEQDNTGTQIAAADEIEKVTDAGMPGASPETEADHLDVVQDIRMQYQGARVLPISLSVIERELQALYEIVESDPGNSAQWGYHLWLLRCAAAHIKPPLHGVGTQPPPSAPTVSKTVSRVRGVLEASRRRCEQTAAAESARMASMHERIAQNSNSVGAASDQIGAAGGDADSNAKWKVGGTVAALAALAHQRALLALVDTLQLLQRTFPTDGEQGTASILEAYRKLQEVDPLRRGYYADQITSLESYMATTLA